MLATPSLLVNLHTYFGAREFVHARTQRCNGQLQAGLGFRGTGGAMEAEHALPPEEQATIDKSVFKGAHVLTNSEMRFLLNGHINAKKQKNPAYEPPSVMQRTMDYVNKFACGKNEEVMREIRRVLFNHQLKEFEVGIIANLMPETAEEAKCLVPSLKDPERYPNDDELQLALDEIAQYREFQ